MYKFKILMVIPCENCCKSITKQLDPFKSIIEKIDFELDPKEQKLCLHLNTDNGVERIVTHLKDNGRAIKRVEVME